MQYTFYFISKETKLNVKIIKSMKKDEKKIIMNVNILWFSIVQPASLVGFDITT